MPHLKKSIALVIERLYPERQIFYRSRGRVRFIAFSRQVQIALSLILLPTAVWSGYHMTDLLAQQTIIAAQQLRVTELRTAQTQTLARHTETLAQNEALARENNNLQSYLSGTLDRMAEMKASHEELVTLVQERTESTVQDLEQTVAMTGLNLNKLLRAAGKTSGGMAKGQGGPFVDPSETNQNRAPFIESNSWDNDVALLDQRLSRWADLQSVVTHLPIAAPVDNIDISSGFGKRADPFSHKSALHKGIDLSAPPGTPVYASAPGLVTFAGPNGPYGNMVEINHGLGLKTRHGHLAKVLVKFGDKLAYQDKIGLIGSTGRSTGSHLHYEVLFNGVWQNPTNFLEAGRHVLKK